MTAASGIHILREIILRNSRISQVGGNINYFLIPINGTDNNALSFLFFQLQMIEHISSLMNGIRMIHSVSLYYNTSERMTALFVKITNQMITTCKEYIKDGDKVWDLSR